ncbi:MAG: HAMP domain-containing protein, partial [Chloroflexia bacterium]|nr:HAMP domain-containing protein [Chloroflexia bacterium]
MTARRLPVRWRLALLYAALLAVSMMVFGGALYVVLRQQLYTSFDEQLLNQAALTLASIDDEDDVPSLEPSISTIPDGEYFLRLLDTGGRTIFETGGNPAGVPIEDHVVAAALGGRSEHSAALDDDGEVMRLVSVPIRSEDANGAITGVLQIGLDRNEIDETLSGLLTTLALAGPAVLLVAAVGGYLLAGRALAPVATITTLAAGIGAGDLRSRLNLDLPDDELGRLANTFDGMLARIDDAFERQRRFTGDAAHELRTPLSLMRSQVDLALARPRSAVAYREALQGFDGDIDRMTALVGTLLTLARSDAGQLAPDRAPFDLADTMHLIVEQYAPVAEEAGVPLRDEAAPAPLVADEDLLVHLVVNLVDNALAHTPSGGTVTLGCRSENGQVRLWVADTGEGIAPDDRDRVFDRFYRDDAGRTRARRGTGLGLAICKAIAEAHGG